MFSRRAPTLLLWLLAAANPACRCDKSETPAAKPRPVPALGQVEILDRTGPDQIPAGVSLELEALVQDAKTALNGANIFAPAKPGPDAPPAARVHIDVALENVVHEGKGAARAGVRLRIDTRPSEIAADHWDENVEAGAETQYQVADEPDLDDLFQRLASRTIGDLLGEYVRRQRLWAGLPANVLAAIDKEKGALQIEAIQIAGNRALKEAAPRLLQLLEHEEEAVRDAALGALVRMRERKAVAALAESRSMRNQREMYKILDAIATLGGQEAAEYLSFVADGHEDPEIRQLAAEAKKRLQR